MLARKLMTGDPAIVTGTDNIMMAAELMRTRGVGMLPVVESHTSRRLIGVLTDRDIVVRSVAPGHGGAALVHTHMTRDPLVTVTEEESETEVAARMKQFQVRRVPVVDAQGAVVGVVAQADLAISIGPDNPILVEQVLESISRPGVLTH